MAAVPVLTANSPSAGYIAWTEFHISYQGAAYDVLAGNTNKKYTAWLWNLGTPVMAFNDTQPTIGSANGTVAGWAGSSPTLGPDDLLLFLNQAGVPINVQSAQLVEGDLIATGTVTAAQIAGGTITGNKIQSGAITAGLIAAGAVTAGTIASGAVTAGTVQAGAIDGMTITGAVLQTAFSGTRVVIDGVFSRDRIQFFSGSTLVGSIVADPSNGCAIYGGTTTNNFVSVTNNGVAITGTVNGVTLTPQAGSALWLNGPVQLGAVANSPFFNASPVTINIDNSAHRGLAINGVSGLSVAYIECLNNSGTRVFAVTSTGAIQSTSTTITSTSDRRLKENIQYLPSNGSLKCLTQLKPATFEWIWNKGQTEYGLIAQDVQKVFPEHVEADDVGMLRITLPFQEHAIMALREVSERLDKLEAKVGDGHGK